MPTRDTAPIGSPCWVDLMTSDTERSRAFYCRLFGWEAEEPSEEFGGYFTFTKDGARVAGCMASQPGAGEPDVWSVYLATDDAGSTDDAATANGGQVHVEPMAVGDLGTMAFVTDAGGAGIGVWQPSIKASAFSARLGRRLGSSCTPGTMRARSSSIAIVFRWDTHVASDTPEFRYTTLGHGDEGLAGIMDVSGFLPDGVPAHWSVYFGVDDTDAALSRIAELGGSVVLAAEDTPYGRLAAATDPTGSKLKLVGPNAAMPASGSPS